MLRVQAVAVIVNDAAQAPYALPLDGTSLSRTGVVLLGATLAWFVAACLLFRTRRRGGFRLLLGYVLAQVASSLNSDLILTLRGFGLPSHLLRTTDPTVWWMFIGGDLNFLAACAAAFVLIRWGVRDHRARVTTSAR